VLRQVLAEMERRLAAESRRGAAAEARLAAAQAAIAEERVARADAERMAVALRRELDAVETLLGQKWDAQAADDARTFDDARTVDDASDPRLDGIVLLYVGGRPHQVAHLRAAAGRIGATLLHHDGGIENHTNLLPGLTSQADLVLFPVDCISHKAALSVKSLCRQAGKRFVPLRSVGVTSLLAALRRPDLAEAAE
jgi:hypothetical protein